MDGEEEVSVRGTGNALREFVFADDVADACLYFLNNGTNGNSFVNIGTEDEISVHDLAYMIKDIVGYNGDIVFDVTKPEGRLRRKLDASLSKTLGWSAKTDLKTGLQQTYHYFLNIK